MNTEVKFPDGPPTERDPRPLVRPPRPGLPGFAIVVIAIAAAVLLFLVLDAQRRSVQSPDVATATGPAFAPPPPLAIPQEGVVQPQVLPPPPVFRPLAPAYVPPAPRYSPAPPPPPPIVQEPVRQDRRPLPPPTRTEGPAFSRHSSETNPALVVDNSSSGLPVGTLIPAVLETPIDTTRPGPARAIVSRDTYAADGQRILVPRGSRLIGEYQSDVRAGQSRVLVNWTRVVRPDGAVLRLGAPAVDQMGAAGIPGRANSFFLSRFLNAALQTALMVGGNLVSGGAANTVIVGMPAGGVTAVAGQGLISGDDRRPRIRVKAGTLFNVFVSRDVDLNTSAAAEPVPAPPPPPQPAQ